MNQKIDASIQADILVPCIPKDSSSSAPLNLLSQLLLQPMVEIVERSRLITVEFFCPLKCLWHPRYIADLAKKNGCPPLASETPRQYMIIKVR